MAKEKQQKFHVEMVMKTIDDDAEKITKKEVKAAVKEAFEDNDVFDVEVKEVKKK